MSAVAGVSRRALFRLRLDVPAFVVDADRCLARSFCSTCLERCPVPGAIEMQAGFPRITGACTSCGECARVCPAPGGAILAP
jgi:ferredoxin